MAFIAVTVRADVVERLNTFPHTPDWQIDHWIKLTERDTAAPVTAKTPPHSLIVLVPERTLSVLEVEVKNPPADWVDTL